MKKIFLLSLFLVTSVFYSQTSGITYQAIIYNPNGETLPGVNNVNAPIANKSVCLKFSIVDFATQTEYQENITTVTDEFGMVNLVIGSGVQNGGYATSFSNIYWSDNQKSLKVSLDILGQCSNFVVISNQKFESVPFAFAANSAENVTGVVPIENGGTNAITVLGAKTNLGLQNVDNTRDSDKPVSTATQTALNLKEDLANKSIDVTVDGASNVKYPSVKAVKTYVDASTTAGTIALADEAAVRAAADTILTNNLASEVTIRTNADLLKEVLVNKSNNVFNDGTSTTKYPTVKSVKDYVDANVLTASNSLASETAARIAADNIITTNIAAEINRATETDNTLTSNLLSEFIRATASENTISSNLATEITNRTNADTFLQTNITTLGATVTANATTAAAATDLKENSANKSTDVTLADATNTKFPTELAVKTYVNASASSGTTALTNEATIRAATDTTLQTNINTLGSTVSANASTAAAATALKENSANKSTDVTLADATNTKFPTELAVKTYVTGQIATANATNANLTGMVTSNGNATTVVTNANLTGPITSTGNATAIANGAITNVMLANGAVANLTGTNSGDQTNIAGNAATVTTNANLTGMVTSNGNATTVVTNANLTGPITSTGNATAIANGAITNTMLANGAVANLTGTNSGDQTNIAGNARL